MTALPEILTGTVQVLVVGLLLGAGLPLLFSVGIRLQDVGAGRVAEDGTRLPANTPARYGAWVIFGVVLLAVVYGLLFLTKSSISHYLGIDLPL